MQSPASRYQTTQDMVAVFLTDNRKMLRIVPAGAVLSINEEPATDLRFISATWEHQSVLIFRLDLEKRAAPVTALN